MCSNWAYAGLIHTNACVQLSLVVQPVIAGVHRMDGGDSWGRWGSSGDLRYTNPGGYQAPWVGEGVPGSESLRWPSCDQNYYFRCEVFTSHRDRRSLSLFLVLTHLNILPYFWGVKARDGDALCTALSLQRKVIGRFTHPHSRLNTPRSKCPFALLTLDAWDTYHTITRISACIYVLLLWCIKMCHTVPVIHQPLCAWDRHVLVQVLGSI